MLSTKRPNRQLSGLPLHSEKGPTWTAEGLCYKQVRCSAPPPTMPLAVLIPDQLESRDMGLLPDY